MGGVLKLVSWTLTLRSDIFKRVSVPVVPKETASKEVGSPVTELYAIAYMASMHMKVKRKKKRKPKRFWVKKK